ncbi:MAG: hypothetical protein FWG10_07350 [Eubacteriaceae bacterium]|nr:hypothetical protein [Eubacteriaceae bacterium]
MAANEDLGLKKAMLVASIITAMVLPAYCGKLAGIGCRTGSSREALWLFYSWRQLGRQHAGRLCRRCRGENGFCQGKRSRQAGGGCLSVPWAASFVPLFQDIRQNQVQNRARPGVGFMPARGRNCLLRGFRLVAAKQVCNPALWAKGYGVVCALGAKEQSALRATGSKSRNFRGWQRKKSVA